MKIRYALCSAVIALLMAVPPYSHAQVTTLQETALNFLWQAEVGYGDMMTTAVASERDSYANYGSIFYVPSYPDTAGGTTSPMYRDYTPWIPDHMDSTIPGEGGYSTEGILAYPYNSSNVVPGLTELIRGYNGSDHATTQAGFLFPGYWLDEYFPFWGFPRYGLSTWSPLSLSGGTVTITSNAVAGGAIWSWQWNGAEFIDSTNNDSGADCGREMQSSFQNFTNPTTDQNPTEAGSKYCGPNADASEDWQGSPLVTLYNNGATQTSASIPLEFEPDQWAGGEFRPILYAGMQLGKQITLNYQNFGPVAQYITTLTVPSTGDAQTMEIPTAYSPTVINGSPFSEFFVYDVANNQVDDVTSCVGSDGFEYTLVASTTHTNQCVTFNQSSGFAGVIISTEDGNYAFGVYGVGTILPNGQHGGSVSNLWLYNNTMGAPV